MAHVGRTNWIRDDLLKVHDAAFQAFIDHVDAGVTDEQIEKAAALIQSAVDDYFGRTHVINLINRRRVERSFRRNLAERYVKALAGTYQVNTIASGAGELGSALFARKHGRPLDWEGGTADELKNDEFRDWALIQLHGRACLLFAEIVGLIESGFASGAMARRRTLFEILVVMKFIYQHGDRAAEAYWDHEAISARRSALEFNKYYADQPEFLFTDIELETLNREAEDAIERHFPNFGKDWGWAASVLGLKGITFQRLIELTGYQNRQVFLRLSHNYVHAGPSGTLNNLGSPQGLTRSTRIVFSGASNAGLSIPASIACEELGTCTAIVLEATNSLVGASVARYLHRLIGTTTDLWSKAENRLAAEEESEHGID